MAALKPEIKAFMVQSVACFGYPLQVVESVLKEFGVQITRQQVEQNDPTKISSRAPAQKWVDLFNRTVTLNEISDIPNRKQGVPASRSGPHGCVPSGMKNLALTAEGLLSKPPRNVGMPTPIKHKFEHSGSKMVAPSRRSP